MSISILFVEHSNEDMCTVTIDPNSKIVFLTTCNVTQTSKKDFGGIFYCLNENKTVICETLVTEEEKQSSPEKPDGILRVTCFVVLEQYYDSFETYRFVRAMMKIGYSKGYNCIIMQLSEDKHVKYIDDIVDTWYYEIEKIPMEDAKCRKLIYYSAEASMNYEKESLNKK